MADMSVTLEEAYQEACLALGEVTVRERLLMKKAYFPENDETAKALETPTEEGGPAVNGKDHIQRGLPGDKQLSGEAQK